MPEEGSGGTIYSLVDELGLGGLLRRESEGETGPCACELAFQDDLTVVLEGTQLLVDAAECDGNLANAPACREHVIETLAERDADSLVVQSNGLEYRYDQRAVTFFGAAGRFFDLIRDRDQTLAKAAAQDPLAVANELEGRVGAIADAAVESGLTQEARDVEDYSAVCSPTVGLTIGHYYLDRSIDSGAKLHDVQTLETGSEVRIYTRPNSVPLYALDVVDLTLSETQRAALLDGYDAIADGRVEGDRAPSRALEIVSDGPVEPTLSAVLAKHTTGYGILEDLFADPRVSDVYETSPVSKNPIRVVVDGQSMATNVHVTKTGVKALASRVRRTSGRAFSRANPTVDAMATLGNGRGVRIAGVTDPVAEGVAFAFREQASDEFTLPALVENDTMTAEVAAFLSIATERNAAALIAGTRGSGKTTLLGTLLYELAPDTRTVVIEDTPELPVDSLQAVDRDVQALRTGAGNDGPEITAADALRTALRLGEGALVVGEIRGEESRVLYEAMRVGANANAVLGTIHGDGAEDVYERVVTDLQVEPSSFGSTDLVVTVQLHRSEAGRTRRVARIEEVLGNGEDIWFEPLYALDGETAAPTGRIDRGESQIVDHLSGPGETYADVRAAIAERTRLIERLASDGRTSPAEVAATYAGRGSE